MLPPSLSGNYVDAKTLWIAGIIGQALNLAGAYEGGTKRFGTNSLPSQLASLRNFFFY
jgi:hypothetical protein